MIHIQEEVSGTRFLSVCHGVTSASTSEATAVWRSTNVLLLFLFLLFLFF